MGDYRHTVILVIANSYQEVRRAWEQAPLPRTAIQATTVNMFFSFAVCPHGSKMGWPASNSEEAERKVFTDWLDAQGRCQWVEATLGDYPSMIAGGDHVDRSFPIALLRERNLLLAVAREVRGGKDASAALAALDEFRSTL